MWLELMKERLDGSSMSEKDKILTIKDHLTGEARDFLMNKSQEDRKRLSRVFKIVSSERFGAVQNQRQAKMEFNSRYQERGSFHKCS